MEIVGHPPELTGLLCEAFICEGFVHEGKLVEDASTVHLRFAGIWHRLILDCGAILWRRSVEAPAPWTIDELDYDYPHTDVGEIAGVVGRRLEHYRMQSTPSCTEVIFSFENGRTVIINNVNDRSTWRIV